MLISACFTSRESRERRNNGTEAVFAAVFNAPTTHRRPPLRAFDDRCVDSSKCKHKYGDDAAQQCALALPTPLRRDTCVTTGLSKTCNRIGQRIAAPLVARASQQ